MANTLTLLQLRNACKVRANMPNDDFIPDTDWNQFINESNAEFRDLVIGQDMLNYLSSSVFTVVTGSSYPVPDGFYEANGLDRLVSGAPDETGCWADVEQYQHRDRNSFSRNGSSNGSCARYNIYDNRFVFQPPNSGVGQTFRVFCYPQAQPMVNDTDAFVDSQGYWYQYVIVDVAIKALNIEESDTSLLQAQKQALMDRIQVQAARKNVMDSMSVGPKEGWYPGVGGRQGWRSG